ncbi:MAG: PIN domain-containing protein [Calditrichaeota bacterium]|nr:PIN domain-containing protein [Calditrichota bacterium]
MITAVDTNILLDILIPNQKFLKSSFQKLEIAAKNGTMVICEIVYAELASQFRDHNDLMNFLKDTQIDVKWSTKETFFKASQLWTEYKKHNKKYFCPGCGNLIETKCSICGSNLNVPRRMLNDFIIGIHAQTFADRFLTRDRGFYRNYFSGIEIV